jgi:hypothetical protein
MTTHPSAASHRAVLTTALAVVAVAVGLGLGTAVASAATPNDTACRKLVHGSVSHKELLAYDACRFDRLDAAVKALTPTR